MAETVSITLPASIDPTSIYPQEFLDLIQSRMYEALRRMDEDAKVGYADAQAARGHAGFSAAGMHGDLIDIRARSEAAEVYLRTWDKLIDLIQAVWVKLLDGEQRLALVRAESDELLRRIGKIDEINQARYTDYITEQWDPASTQLSGDMTTFFNLITGLSVEGETDVELLEAKAAVINAAGRPIQPSIVAPMPPFIQPR